MIFGFGPSWVTLVGSVLLASVLSGAGGFVNGVAHEKGKQARNALVQSEHNREVERQASRANSGVDDAYQAKLRASRAVVAATRTERDRLRSAIANLPQVAEAPSGFDGERDAALRRLLAEGAGLVEEGSERVGSLESKVSGLQSYVSKVCQLQLVR